MVQVCSSYIKRQHILVAPIFVVKMLLGIPILVCLILGVQSQENAGKSVAKSLIECYNKSENLDRERRPSSSVTVLIDLMRKIESGPSMQSERLFSKEIIHRFKQDGIITYSTSASNPYSIPYTPKGMQADKHKILLTKLIPGNAVNFPNETLSETQRCHMHFMLSNSMDVLERGDENTVCNKLDRYQRRVRRDVNPNDDIEIFDPAKAGQSKGNLQESEFEHDPEQTDDQVDTNVNQERSSRKTISVHLSQCPVENGAVYSKWGTIQAGTVISGIAAGLEPQRIQSSENYVVDNIYAATLAGDLAEVALHQGASAKETVSVGANGGWNGTQVPKWYFIQKNSDFQMTDAEIRAGLDGLIIGKNIKSWQSKASSLKLSQVLDMYYSPRGVFSKKFRACNRKYLFNEYAPQEDLRDQTIGFSFLLNDEAALPGSITTTDGIKAYDEKAVNALLSYIATLPDLTCEVEDDTISRASTDIIIALDTKWNFKTIYPTLAYLLDNLDINKYDSNFTIINGQNGVIMVNSSYSLLNFYEQYNRTVHTDSPNGFDVAQIFSVIEVMTKHKMDEAQASRKVAGPSSIVLFMPYDPLSSSDSNIATDRKAYFKQSLPDLKLLVLGRNSQDAYSSLVVDSASDAFTLSETSDGTSITGSVKPVISRIRQIHRRIVNPNCGASWTGGPSSDSFDQYIEPNSTNYYRVAPNYFFGEGTRSVKIRGSGPGSLTVCSSRGNEKPSKNDDCKTISSSTEAAFSLSCDGFDEISKCPPAYISVESVGNAESSYFGCSDNGCRFPDNIRYKVQIENFGCNSGTFQIMGNIALLITTFFTIKFLY